ncbi:ABC transporter ATP-binding protein [Flavobacterium luteum]|uniref:ATP-binding cassette domain-containing protein n=1 Tax=Flavobacterium luteum TaxID=2026654 RepID=A0A7J5AIZ0_9FLAO|nr:ATP-binding cassette domain-containing protein [Flavobacterium luteum]KAB1157577.1 ATP-binding cassette domain-containing protein [Flavobacterium luteum]
MLIEKNIKQKKIETNYQQTIIEFKNVYKSFGKNDVLKGFNLSVKKGENVVILGKSGSGKSVAIKCLVGLIKVDKGEIYIFNTDITKLNIYELNKVRMNIGFLFQNGALYDSMTVKENLAFTLKHHSKNLNQNEIENAINEALEDVGLKEAIDKMPSELSGGMKKRIGLSRALIIQPEIILYDEPTSGLDTITSREIDELILKIQKKGKTTSVIITHDLACAKITGDRILIIRDGIIYAEGSFESLKNSDDNWVRSFFI